ncbi:MAG: hypothetical protein AAFY72_05370 [Cyanobacteria bacterium J06649_4]
MEQVTTQAIAPKWKQTLSTICTLCFLTGCAGNASEKTIADQYLALLKSGDKTGAKALACYPKHFERSPLTNIAIDSYRIKPRDEAFAAAFPDGVRSLQDDSITYTRVDAVINEEETTRILAIWRPDAHYQASQAEDAEWQAIGGEAVFGSDRADWSQTAECVDTRDMHARFKQLEPGQTKAQIQEIMGSPGKQVVPNVHIWKNPTSRTARRVTFSNGQASVIRATPYEANP